MGGKGDLRALLTHRSQMVAASRFTNDPRSQNDKVQQGSRTHGSLVGSFVLMSEINLRGNYLIFLIVAYML